jgi:hypothetical protein
MRPRLQDLIVSRTARCRAPNFSDNGRYNLVEPIVINSGDISYLYHRYLEDIDENRAERRINLP